MTLEDTAPSKSQLSILLEHYQSGRYDDAEELALSITKKFPKHQFAWKVIGVVFKKLGRMHESLIASQQSVQLAPQDEEAHNSLGNTLKELGKLEDSEASYRQAIALKPDFAEAHNNLGITLQELGRLKEAEVSYTQTIALKPDYSKAHYNLGNTLKELGRLEEAEVSLRQAIMLKPDFTEAHNNLGMILKGLGRLEEAEARCKQAIALKPNFAQVHYSLGIILQELGKLEDSEASYRQAIALKHNFALAHYGLGKVLYSMSYKDPALESIKRANTLDPKSKNISVLLSVLTARKLRENSETGDKSSITQDCLVLPPSTILELNMSVEQKLITYLYSRKLLNLDKEKEPSFGNTKGSMYDLFEDNHPTIQKLELDLNNILMKTFNSDIFIKDSFFSIFGAGGGTIRHHHVDKSDEDSTFSLAKQKYALVYYLSAGDQDCTEPGFLKFYEPNQKILPSKGLIAIFPADRFHSSFYGGNKDRVIVGVNFYTLNVNSLNPSQQQLSILLEHYQSGRYDDAEELALSITKKFPKHQFAWKVIGVVFKKLGRMHESLIASQQSVQLAPQDEEAHNSLGNTLKELGKLEDSEASYRQAIALKPDFAEAHNNLGITLQELGRLKEAEVSYTQTIALKPDYSKAHYNLGNTLKELGRLEEAEVSYAAAIALKTDFAEAHYNLGKVLMKIGRHREGLREEMIGGGFISFNLNNGISIL